MRITLPRALTWLLLPLFACAPEGSREGPAAATEPEPPAIPRRTKVAGMWGLDVWTRVTFAEAPQAPHRLQTSLGFPERTRWLLVPEHNPLGGRRIVYEHGRRVFLLDVGQETSSELEGQERAEQMRHMLLRRALLVPEALSWNAGTAERREVDLGPFGRLASEGPKARPRRLATWSRDGELSFHVESIEWSEEPLDGRTWPQSWELHQGSALLWREELASVDTAISFYTDAFLPADRRAGERAVAHAPRLTRRGPSWSLRLALDQESDWTAAERAAERAVLDEQRAGRRVQQPVSFELDRHGRAAAVLLVLPEEASPPAPWRADAAGPILELQLTAEDLPEPEEARAHLESLLREAERRDLRPGKARLHRLPERSGARLVLDVEPRGSGDSAEGGG